MIATSIIGGVIFTLTMCNEVKEKEQPEDELSLTTMPYVGGRACIKCHKEIYESHVNTPHFKTSALASAVKIKGSFSEGENSYRFSERTIVKCEKAGDKFYQVAYVDAVEKMRQDFDIVFGYGKKAQSFASWSKNKLVQLPLSYFTINGHWINSPGYPEKVVFNRVITSRCMECHATFAQVISEEGLLENFNQANIVLGIDCEKCHGPASMHVDFKTKNPNQKDEKYIVNPSRLVRQKSLDLCAVCHSGNMNNLQPSFSFRPGDDLSKFYSSATPVEDVENLDVHGNQYGLLTASKCFRQSQMTCSSCHDSHKNEEGQIATFSQRCMVCHPPEKKNTFCTVKNIEQSSLKQNCIDCHMPEKESAVIIFSNHENGKKISAKMRSHFIKIYPEETQKIISFLNKSDKTHF